MYVMKNDVRFKINEMRRNKNNKEIIMNRNYYFQDHSFFLCTIQKSHLQ